MFQLRDLTYARYNFVENIWIMNTRLRYMEKRCLCFMLGSIDLRIYNCRRFTVKLMQLCGWNNLLVIRILSRISIEEHENGTWLIPENSQSVPHVLISSDSCWNPQCLKETACRYCHCKGQTDYPVCSSQDHSFIPYTHTVPSITGKLKIPHSIDVSLTSVTEDFCFLGQCLKCMEESVKHLVSAKYKLIWIKS